MTLQSRFIDYVKHEDLFHAGDKLVIAVSGGVDSVVLATLCNNAGFDFIMAHCNFNLRKNEVEAEKTLVENLAKKLNKQVLVKEFDTEKIASESRASIQVTARELRYEWFEQIVKETGTRYLLTAHHADDNIETLLMNFFKGTGIRGLKGILPKHNNIVRPLLFAKKKELEEFALSHQLEFATDSSNLSDRYSRNFLRHHVIPAIEAVYPAAEDNLLNSLARFRDIVQLYDEAIAFHKKKLLEIRGEEVHIPVLKLLKTCAAESVVYEIIKEYGFTAHQTVDVVKLLTAESGKYVDSHTHRLLKNRNWIIISKKQPEAASIILVEDGEKEVVFENGKLRLQKVAGKEFKIDPSPNVGQFDAEQIRYPLILRKWKQGDYFYPLGMKKKKKLSRFFIDIKLSRNEKDKAWVLEMDKKIVWVIGYRIDERFKLKSSSKDMLKITFTEV